MVQQQPVFKTTTTLFYTLLAGQVMFAVIAYFLVASGELGEGQAELEEIFTKLVPVLIIGGWLAGMFVYDNKIQTAQAKHNAAEKLEIYRSAVIIRCALLEGPVLFEICQIAWVI